MSTFRTNYLSDPSNVGSGELLGEGYDDTTQKFDPTLTGGRFGAFDATGTLKNVIATGDGVVGVSRHITKAIESLDKYPATTDSARFRVIGPIIIDAKAGQTPPKYKKKVYAEATTGLATSTSTDIEIDVYFLGTVEGRTDQWKVFIR